MNRCTITGIYTLKREVESASDGLFIEDQDIGNDKVADTLERLISSGVLTKSEDQKNIYLTAKNDNLDQGTVGYVVVSRYADGALQGKQFIMGPQTVKEFTNIYLGRLFATVGSAKRFANQMSKSEKLNEEEFSIVPVGTNRFVNVTRSMYTVSSIVIKS